MDALTIWMVVGFIFAAYAVIANDSVQTLGTWIASNNEKFHWRTMWIAASAVLIYTLWYGWYMNGGDISYGRLNKIPFQEVKWYHALAPAVLLGANCANPMTVLNSIVARQLIDFKSEVDSLITKKDLKKDEAIFNVLREYIKTSRNILFEGNGYGGDWEKEAVKRGLSNNKNTPDALKVKIDPKTIALYESLNVMNKVEIEARYDIEIEEYVHIIQIEGRSLGDIARNHVIPTAVKYQNILIDNVKGLKDIYGKDFKQYASEQLFLIAEISKRIEAINSGVTKMTNERKKANSIDDTTKKAKIYCSKVKPLFDDIRYHCDKLELLIDDELWPLAKYRELLFTK